MSKSSKSPLASGPGPTPAPPTQGLPAPTPPPLPPLASPGGHVAPPRPPAAPPLPVPPPVYSPAATRPPAPLPTAGQYRAQQLQQARRVPAWLVSFTVHLILILLLAVSPIAKLASGPLSITLGFSPTPGIAEFELTAGELNTDAPTEADAIDFADTLTEPSQLLDVNLPELAELRPTPSESSDAVQALANLPVGISAGLTGRSGDRKSDLLAKYGGSAATEAAVDLGLQWLAERQLPNGSWSLVGPYSDGGISENVTAATALALNAFLGAGWTHKDGKYRSVVERGLRFLVGKQNSEGYFPDPREPSRQQMYAQAIASITVTEAYGMTRDPNLELSAQRAMRFAAWSQSNLRGWRYEPRHDADLSVTGWYVMTLITGKMAGLDIDEQKLAQVSEFLDSVSYEEQSRYAYDDFEPPSLGMTAEGLLCRIYLGWPKSHPALLRGVEDDLLANVPRDNDEAYSVYYWYYATQVLHHVGGKPWDQWNRAMKRVLPALQETEGEERGSWSPSKDLFGVAGGRLYTTCLNLYCLEVYYRHLSLYDIR